MDTKIVRTNDEIDEVLEWALAGEAEGSQFPGMSYEQGVKAMFEWLIGNTEVSPKSAE